MRLKYGILFFFLISSFSFRNLVAQPKELNYTVYYHFGPVWIKGGYILLTGDNDTINGMPVGKLTGIGKSDDKWKWIFDIEERYDSWYFKNNFLPIKSTKHAKENSYVINNSYNYDYKNNYVYIKTESTEDSISNDTILLNKSIFDAQTGTNFLRWMNFTGFHDIDTITLNLLLDGELIEQNFIFRKNRTLIDKNNNEYNVILFSAVVEDNSLFSSQEAIKVWVTDDKQRIPLKIKANLKVGAIEILYDDIKLNEPQ